MKIYRSRSGPFHERPHFEASEIDLICATELRKVELLPQQPEPIRIDRFIEKRFKVIPQYDNLPAGVLGYTRFGRAGVEAIVIAAELDTDGSVVAERRLRTTLAHEAGHGLLHGHLFGEHMQQPAGLFDADSRGDNCILCREVPGEPAKKPAYDGRWWEYQANRAIGGLLMPKTLLLAALRKYLIAQGSLGGERLDESRREAAARDLAEVFNVNPIVAKIRVGDLFPQESGSQLSL